MSNEPSGLGAMFGNMVFGPSSNNKKRPAPDDGDGRTDKESESTNVPSSSTQIENCMILDVTKNPLMDDIKLIKNKKFMELIRKAMGSSSSYGWGNYGPHITSDNNISFKESFSANKYFDRKGFYDTCSDNRKNKSQTFIDNTGTKKIDLGNKYNLSSTNEDITTLFNTHFAENKDDPECPSYLLLVAFGEYLNKERAEIEKEYDEIIKLKDGDVNIFENKTDEDDISMLDNNDDAIFSHKMLFCFAWEHAGGNAESKRIDGGMDGKMTIEPIQQRNRYKKILVKVMCIMGYIYFIFVIFEAYRLLLSSVNRILDARVSYLEIHPGEDEIPFLSEEPDEEKRYGQEYLNYLFGFFTVMYQAGAGNLIEILSSYQGVAIMNAKALLSTVTTKGGTTQMDRCMNGWFSCINGYLTGSTTTEAIREMRIVGESELNKSIIDVVTGIKLQFSRIAADYDFATKGFITGINGMLFCTIVLGNQIQPDKYKIAHVTAAYAALQSSYLGGNILGVISIGTNIGVLFRPQTLITESGESESMLPPPPPPPSPSEKGGKRKTGKRLLDIFGGKRKTNKNKKKKKKNTIKKIKGKRKNKRKTIKKRRKLKK